MVQQQSVVTCGLATAALVVLIAVGVGAAPTDKDSGAATAGGASSLALAAPAEKTSEVKKVYTTYCQACHGEDGKGATVKPAMSTIPDFTDRKWQDETSDVQIKVSVLDGKGALMPPFRDKISADENSQLTALIREFAPK